jgi:group I intron endonuclease
MAYGIVYKTTNLENGKTYIGQTCRKDSQVGNYIGSGNLIKKAISKYGKDSFIRETLFECNSQDQLDRMERLSIALFGPDYNIAIGGANGCMKGLHHSDKTKEKCRVAALNRSPETREKISNAHLGMKASAETRLAISVAGKGRKLSEIACLHIAQAKKGNKNPNYGKSPSPHVIRAHVESTSKAVVCIETGTIYRSIASACNELGLVSANIGRCCDGHKYRKTCGGYHWRWA